MMSSTLALRQLTRTLAASQSKKIGTTARNGFIYRTLDNIREDKAIKVGPTFESRRYILRKDCMGFSFHHTVVYKYTRSFFHYKNHLEAVLIVKGKGWLEVVPRKEDLGKGTRYELFPGVAYGLDGHEMHYLTCGPEEDLHAICVFSPPCSGTEVHNDEGIYPYIGKDGVPDYNFWEKFCGKPIMVEVKDLETKNKESIA